MGILSVTEYERFGRDKYGKTRDTVVEPAVANNNVTFSTATASSVFNAKTRVVRLVSDVACYIIFGTSPTATTSHTYLPSHSVEYFNVGDTTGQNESLKVSAVAK